MSGFTTPKKSLFPDKKTMGELANKIDVLETVKKEKGDKKRALWLAEESLASYVDEIKDVDKPSKGQKKKRRQLKRQVNSLRQEVDGAKALKDKLEGEIQGMYAPARSPYKESSGPEQPAKDDVKHTIDRQRLFTKVRAINPNETSDLISMAEFYDDLMTTLRTREMAIYAVLDGKVSRVHKNAMREVVAQYTDFDLEGTKTPDDATVGEVWDKYLKIIIKSSFSNEFEDELKQSMKRVEVTEGMALSAFVTELALKLKLAEEFRHLFSHPGNRPDLGAVCMMQKVEAEYEVQMGLTDFNNIFNKGDSTKLSARLKRWADSQVSMSRAKGLGSVPRRKKTTKQSERGFLADAGHGAAGGASTDKKGDGGPESYPRPYVCGECVKCKANDQCQYPGLCFWWRDKGECPFDSRCRFHHPSANQGRPTPNRDDSGRGRGGRGRGRGGRGRGGRGRGRGGDQADYSKVPPQDQNFRSGGMLNPDKKVEDTLVQQLKQMEELQKATKREFKEFTDQQDQERAAKKAKKEAKKALEIARQQALAREERNRESKQAIVNLFQQMARAAGNTAAQETTVAEVPQLKYDFGSFVDSLNK